MTKTHTSAKGKAEPSTETFDATGGPVSNGHNDKPSEIVGKKSSHHSKPNKSKKSKKGNGKCSDAMDRWLNEERKDGPWNSLL